MSEYKEITVTKEYLDENPTHLFVFGDNTIHQGYGGAAILRDHPQAVGFITKKLPDNNPESFYRPEEYCKVFFSHLRALEKMIEENKDKVFLISKLGAGLANRHFIWEKLIKHNLEMSLCEFENVIFLWED
jgi:hypothetical protein